MLFHFSDLRLYYFETSHDDLYFLEHGGVVLLRRQVFEDGLIFLEERLEHLDVFLYRNLSTLAPIFDHAFLHRQISVQLLDVRWHALTLLDAVFHDTADFGEALGAVGHGVE